MRSDYHGLLGTAASEQSVVGVVVRYLADWSPAELASIPAGCRPRMVGDAEEIADLAYMLTKARIESQGSNPLLEEMESFFAHACTRVSELEAPPRRLPGKSYLTR